MSQHDLDIAAGRGIDVRADINNAIKALASNFSGSVAPTNPQPSMWWSDTAANRLKRRNVANTDWIDCGPIDRTPFFPTDMVASAGGTADAITASFTPAVTSLVNGLYVCVRASGMNVSSAPTFTPSAGVIAAKPIVKWGGVALSVGDIYGPGHWIELQYDAVLDKWILLNPCRMANELPVGSVIYTAGSVALPQTLKANGANVSRTAYAALFSVIGTTYGSGDGSTTFTLPDLRAEFIRGWDDGRGVDTGRSIGSAQSDAIRNITASVAFDSASGVISTGGVATGAFAIGSAMANRPSPGSASNTGAKLDFDASKSVPTAGENRPRNMAMLALIKY